ncbi:MAG: hypothetical protein ACK5JC_10230 [Bacteroidota bacterium]
MMKLIKSQLKMLDATIRLCKYPTLNMVDIFLLVEWLWVLCFGYVGRFGNEAKSTSFTEILSLRVLRKPG